MVSQYSSLLSPIAVDCVLRVIDPLHPASVDLRDVRIVKKVGGTVDDTTMVTDGLILDAKASHAAGGPTRVQNAKIALIQFCVSAPKTDMENNVVVSDYAQARGSCRAFFWPGWPPSSFFQPPAVLPRPRFRRSLLTKLGLLCADGPHV